MERENRALLLGTFNPFHIGHLLCVITVYNRNIVDKIEIIPAWQNPWKNKTGNFDIRCEIVETMIEGLDNIVTVSRIEGEIKPKYTYELLEYLKRTNPNIDYSLICGTDTANNITKWKNGQWIKDNFNIIEIDRPTDGSEQLNGINISSTKIRSMIKNGENPIPFINLETFNLIKKYKIYD